MRKTLILTASLTAIVLGAGAYAQSNPFERVGRILKQKPAPTPTERPDRQRPTTTGSKPSATGTAAAGPIKDQGVHNAVHAAHQNQIVFTRTDTTIGAITEAAIVSDFTLGQPMFFRVFTEKSAVNAIAAANNMSATDVYAVGVRYTARFTIDGQVIETTMWPWGNPQDHQTWTTWRGQFVNTINAQRTPGTDIFMEMLSKATAAGLLKPGKHSIKMEVVPEVAVAEDKFVNGGTVASGTFNLTVPAGIFQAGNTAVCGPARGATASAALEARALSEARRVIRTPDYTPVRAVGIGEGWDIDRNEVTGIPIQRDTTVAILARGAKYCSANVHYFIEDYMGGGNFGTSTGSISLKATPRYIPCACLG